jgi:hypothetical protein
MEINITDEQRVYQLVAALEGGSNYWYNFDYEANEIINSVPQLETDDACFVDTFVWKLWSALKAGKEIPVSDIETGEVLGNLSIASIERGEETMLKDYVQDFADILSGNDDAGTGDIWFQLAVMNDIVYG